MNKHYENRLECGFDFKSTNYTLYTMQVFLNNDNDARGWADIHTSFLGSDSVSVTGTGSLAEIVFTTLTSGISVLNYGQSSELVNQDDVQIQIKGFGTGTIDAQ